jgi:hypothetical protein
MNAAPKRYNMVPLAIVSLTVVGIRLGIGRPIHWI